MNMPEKKPKQNIIDDPNREYVVGLIKAIGGVEKTLSNLENSPTVAIMKALQEKLENGNDVASFMWSLLRGPRGEKGDSIKGDPGPQGIPGKQGDPGEPGKSLDEGEILRKLLKSIPDPIPGPRGLPGEKGKDAVVDYAKIIDTVIEKLPKNKNAKKELLKISIKDIEDFPEIGQLVRKYVYDFSESRAGATIVAPGASNLLTLADVNPKDLAIGFVPTWNGTQFVFQARDSGMAGGSDTQVQFNDGGVVNGLSGLIYDKVNGFLRVGGSFANETGALRVNGAVYASAGFGIPGLTQLTLDKLYSAVSFSFKGYNGTAQTDIMKFENQGTTNLSANFLTRLGVNISLPGGIFHSRTSSVTVPGTSNTFAILADGGASSGLMGIGADNTYGYIQSFNAKPMWLNNAGNNLYFGNSAGRSGFGLSVTSLPTKYVFGNKPADDNIYAYDTDTMVITHQTATGSATLNDPKQVLILGRQGAAGAAYSAGAVFSVSRYENVSVNSRTRLDISLAHNAFDLTSNIALTLLSSGATGFGTTAPVTRIHLYQNSTDTGNFTGQTIEQAGTGDAVTQYILTGVRRWVTGIDNSDSDSFKFSPTADLANGVLSIATDGEMTQALGKYFRFNSDTNWRIGGVTATAPFTYSSATGNKLNVVYGSGATDGFGIGSNGGNSQIEISNDKGVYFRNGVSFGVTTAPTALVHIKAGTATANTGPLKFTAGVVTTTPEAGLVEFVNAEDGLTFTAVSTRRKFVLDTATQTLTGKRITNRVQTVASSATVTPSWDNDDVVTITAQAVGLTLANPTGTPTAFQPIKIRVKDNGTARTIAYGAGYRAIGVTLPTTTVISKTLYLGGFWNEADSKLDITSVAQEA